MRGKSTESDKGRGVARKHTTFVEGSSQFAKFIETLTGVNRVSLGPVHHHGKYNLISFSARAEIKANDPAGKIVMKWSQTTGCQEVVVIPVKDYWPTNRDFVAMLVTACRAEYPDFQVQDAFKVIRQVQPEAVKPEPIKAPTVFGATVQSTSTQRSSGMPAKILVSQRAYDIYQRVIGMAVMETAGKVFSGTLKSVIGRSDATLWGRELAKKGVVRMLQKGRWFFPDNLELEIKPATRGLGRLKTITQHPVPATPPHRSRKEIVIVIPEAVLKEAVVKQDDKLKYIIIDALFINEQGELRPSEELIAINLAFQAAAKDIEFIEQDRLKSETLFKLAQSSLLRKQKR